MVKDLSAGDSLMLYNQQNVAINSIIYQKGSFEVFNFEVADYHTYYVSDQHVLVHNSGPCDLIVKALRSDVGNYNHIVGSISDAHTVAAKKFRVSVPQFSDAIANKDLIC